MIPLAIPSRKFFSKIWKMVRVISQSLNTIFEFSTLCSGLFLSDSQDDVEKKEDSASAQTSGDSTTSTAEGSSQDEQQKAKPETPKPLAAPPRPTVGTPVNRPRIGTPIGTPIGKPATPAAPAPPSQAASKPPAVGAPVQRPSIGTPVGSRPSVGTPIGSRPAAAVGTPAPAAPRPVVSSPTAGRPTTPAKKPESKADISRRNFMRGLMLLGGLVAVLQFGALGPFLQGTVAGKVATTQKIADSITSAPITTASFSTAVQWLTFVYPATGNPNIDADTFRQCVIIKLPAGFTAPASLSASDSTGTYVGFSRVCVHLWCLWSYVPTDMRMECPCHGSQYVPGSGIYPKLPTADNKPPGLAVEGPASLQTPPNNMLPMIKLQINSDSSFTATGVVGVVGCGQDC